MALQIKNKYPDVYRRYHEYCDEHRAKNLLGRMLLVPVDDGKVICNLFGQERFGYGKQYTDIAALSKAMNSLAKIVPVISEPIAMPYMIGTAGMAVQIGVLCINSSKIFLRGIQ